ncbi:hypothetical protein B296_00048965 [Ensete ventricosum]|uniref:Uncharacterized protein n=1 Tax=Ensete ventricosum TaxID=4639 RepID=A0A426WXA5_ENSVE|nr:hypothetical protein B296_00048965 [Ensete ventricosum]
MPTGCLIYSKYRCPSGWTGIIATRAVAPVGTVLASAYLEGWRHPRRGHLRRRCPCRHQPCPQAAAPANDCPLRAGHVRSALKEPWSIVYYLLRSLVEHSCINLKSLAFSYLDEKPIDIGLMKFLSLCPSALSWYLEFVFVFSTSSAPFTTNDVPP